MTCDFCTTCLPQGRTSESKSSAASRKPLVGHPLVASRSTCSSSSTRWAAAGCATSSSSSSGWRRQLLIELYALLLLVVLLLDEPYALWLLVVRILFKLYVVLLLFVEVFVITTSWASSSATSLVVMKTEDQGVPLWTGDPASFEAFATACRWYTLSLKENERRSKPHVEKVARSSQICGSSSRSL